MAEVIRIYTDGCAISNGQPGSIGAAAAILHHRAGEKETVTRCLPHIPPPTNQRAELMGVILGLERILEIYGVKQENEKGEENEFRVYSDSKYVTDCMTNNIFKWMENGWKNISGRPVTHMDLLQQTVTLDEQVSRLGNLQYILVGKGENVDADRACHGALEEEKKAVAGTRDAAIRRTYRERSPIRPKRRRPERKDRIRMTERSLSPKREA